MTHEDAGHYGKKHPEGTKADPDITKALTEHVKNGKVSCAAAHAVATELNATPKAVGKTIDLLEHRICKCQLGLFGYEPEKKCVRPADSVSPDLSDKIKKRLVDDRLPCTSSWEIAEELDLSKMAVSSACETLGVKIKPCQLGAF